MQNRARKKNIGTKSLIKSLDLFITNAAKLLFRSGIDTKITFNGSDYEFGICFTADEMKQQEDNFKRFISDYLITRMPQLIDMVVYEKNSESFEFNVNELFCLFNGISSIRNVDHYRLRSKAIELKKEEYLKHSEKKSVILNKDVWVVKNELGLLDDTVVKKSIGV